jgi:6,7-dimethyl-8-ribityllumazine synthase
MSNSNQEIININGLHITNARVVVVYTEWNEKIITELRAGVKKTLSLFPSIQIEEFAVPGAVEIPFAIKRLYQVTDADAFIALGCVIRGGTPHFEYVCQSVTQGITELNTTILSPVIMGVLTVENETQAWERLGGAHGHKGEEAAITAVKMIHFSNQFPQ